MGSIFPPAQWKVFIGLSCLCLPKTKVIMKASKIRTWNIRIPYYTKHQVRYYCCKCCTYCCIPGIMYQLGATIRGIHERQTSKIRTKISKQNPVALRQISKLQIQNSNFNIGDRRSPTRHGCILLILNIINMCIFIVRLSGRCWATVRTRY